MKCNKRSKTLRVSASLTILPAGHSEPIPVDLILEILSRLPLKSIARCRCVSKPWASMLGLPLFNDLFITKSCLGPKILFAHHKNKNSELVFFSSPLPQNLDAPLAVNYHMKFVVDQHPSIFSPINGFVCIKATKTLKGRQSPIYVTVICNPSTGLSFTLPKMKTRRWTSLNTYLGYDPIGKQFKVLAMTSSSLISEEHQVLTLGGTGQPSWRIIDCGIRHDPQPNVICINGVLFYVASPDCFAKTYMIVCFDVRSEKFSSAEIPEAFLSVTNFHATFINYNNKLASLGCAQGYRYYISGKSRSFEMCILEDPQKHEWSKRIYEFPTLWQYEVGINVYLKFVGVTAKNEVMLTPSFPRDTFYVIYYSLERKTITRVYIQGMGAVNSTDIYAFLDHVENVRTL